MKTQEMLDRLVSFDTTSALSNMPLIEFVRDFLDGHGIDSTLIPDKDGKKANLHAVIGPAELPGIVLSGHTDVVPVTGQDWTSDPFALTEREGLLYGRGTCDMKGFIAAVLAKVPELAKADLSAPIHLAFSYDEEVGCLGARDLSAHLEALPVRPKICIVGEPTLMKPVTGHKGIQDFHCHVKGKESHSSLAPYAVNAVEFAGELVSRIRRMAKQKQAEGPFNPLFDPPFTTIHVGTIQGGTAQNIVPKDCHFSFEFRSIPEEDTEALIDAIRQQAFRDLEPEMKAIDPGCGIDFLPGVAVPAFDIADNDPIVETVLALSGANTTRKVSFATEAGIFSASGIPTVICGPGDIEQAHKPDEFVSIEQLGKCDLFLGRLIDKLAT